MSNDLRVRVFHPIYARNAAISHICMSLCAGMIEAGADVRMVVPGREKSLNKPFVSSAFPTSLNGLAYRLFSPDRVVSLSARVFLRSLRRGDVAYLWPGTPLWVYQAVKDLRCPLVMERINTHRRTARRILTDAYARLGMSPPSAYSDEAIADEDAKLALADAVFSPSPCVTDSLVDSGVPASKIIQSSYGWDPARLGVPPVASETEASAGPTRPADAPFTALFMGRICVRKGAHLLLEAWEQSGVSGRLRLVGRLDDEVRDRCAKWLARPDVDALPYTNDVASVFADADVFAFPTLEEGSPLVVYEALASGLPVLTTPMGAGHVVRQCVEGRIVPPQDVAALAETLRVMAAARSETASMRGRARMRAAEFTWSRVGRRRAEQLAEFAEAWSGVARVAAC